MPKVDDLSVGPGETSVAPRPPAYDSKFDNWDERAAVRTKPLRRPADDGPALHYFPPESVPALRHPLVRALDPADRDRLLVHALYQYLHFTVVLEQTAVIPITSRIALGSCPVELPEPMRADAFRITTDEAWHAQFSYDLMRGVARRAGVAVPPLGRPPFVHRLRLIRGDFDSGLGNLAEWFFAVVSETLVSSILSEIPGDKRLPLSVRAVVADHAEDEGRHHAYFRAFLRFAWPALSARERSAVGSRVPDLVRAFLEPDRDAVRRALAETPLAADDARQVVEESYTGEWARARVASAARATVRSFRDVGALDDPRTLDAFLAAGLA